MAVEPMENCSFISNFCDTDAYHCPMIPCTNTFDCLNRKDEDFNFCNQTISSNTTDRINQAQSEYNG